MDANFARFFQLVFVYICITVGDSTISRDWDIISRFNSGIGKEEDDIIKRNGTFSPCIRPPSRHSQPTVTHYDILHFFLYTNGCDTRDTHSCRKWVVCLNHPAYVVDMLEQHLLWTCIQCYTIQQSVFSIGFKNKKFSFIILSLGEVVPSRRRY